VRAKGASEEEVRVEADSRTPYIGLRGDQRGAQRDGAKSVVAGVMNAWWGLVRRRRERKGKGWHME
jgi:hypothetical protein